MSGDELARKALCAEAFFNDRDQVVFDKIARGSADEEFVLTKTGVEMEKVNALKFETHDCTLPFCCPNLQG